MIELNLEDVAWVVTAHLKTLAAVRGMCVEQRIDFMWCREKELEAAKVLKSIRKVIELKGNVLLVKPKG